MNALKELYFTLMDAICCGDLAGHLRAFWRVATGQVDLEARVVPTGAVVEDDALAPVEELGTRPV